jgi:hypothetical protein
MAWDLDALGWRIMAGIGGGLLVLGVTRPCRFLRRRRRCPQCKQLLPRWDRWGWKDGWTCSRCGCQVGR